MKVEEVPLQKAFGSGFASAWLSGAPEAAAFLAAPRRDARDRAVLGAEVSASSARREALVERLRAYLDPFDPPAPVREATERLRDPRTVVVATAQQPSLLGGPLYNLCKAATAVRLARALDAAGTPAVPLFWNHSEDDDLEEANRLRLPNERFDLVEFRLPPPADRPRLDAWRPGEDGRRWSEEVRAALASPRGRGTAPRLPSLDPDETVGSAFTRLLLELLGNEGLVPIEPAPLRALGAEALARLVEQDGATRAALVERERRLRDAGFDPPVPADRQAPLFALEGTRRRRLRFHPSGGFLADGEREPVAGRDLAARIRERPEGFGPGVLFRPLLQRSALPVAVSVGGPTEIAYHAQVDPLFASLDLPSPAVHPRASLTFVEPEVAHSLERLALRAEETLAPLADLEKRVPLPRPEALDASLDGLAREVSTRVAALEPEVSAVDPTLLGPMRRTARLLEERLGDLRRRVDRAFANRAGVGRRHLLRVAAFLFPGGEPQERGLPLLYFLARRGLPFVQEALEAADPFRFRHRFVFLDPGGEP